MSLISVHCLGDDRTQLQRKPYRTKAHGQVNTGFGPAAQETLRTEQRQQLMTATSRNSNQCLSFEKHNLALLS